MPRPCCGSPRLSSSATRRRRAVPGWRPPRTGPGRRTARARKRRCRLRPPARARVAGSACIPRRTWPASRSRPSDGENAEHEAVTANVLALRHQGRQESGRTGTEACPAEHGSMPCVTVWKNGPLAAHPPFGVTIRFPCWASHFPPASTPRISGQRPRNGWSRPRSRWPPRRPRRSSAMAGTVTLREGRALRSRLRGRARRVATTVPAAPPARGGGRRIVPRSASSKPNPPKHRTPGDTDEGDQVEPRRGAGTVRLVLRLHLDRRALAPVGDGLLLGCAGRGVSE